LARACDSRSICLPKPPPKEAEWIDVYRDWHVGRLAKFRPDANCDSIIPFLCAFVVVDRFPNSGQTGDDG
jgi:hypothetical protein